MKKILFAVLLFLVGIGPAFADNCSAYPYTLQNGQTADANQVMSNFNTILSCGNNQLLAKNNNLSDVQSVTTSRSNLGLGTAALAAATDLGEPLIALNGSAVAGNVPIFTNNNGSIQDSGASESSFLFKSGNLAGLSSVSTSRTNLGLGSIAVQNVTYSTSGPSGSANAGDLWLQYVP